MTTPINISAMFITASKRNLQQLTQDAGFTDASETVNHALVALKTVKDALLKGEKIVVLQPDTLDATEIENLTLDPTLPMTGMISMNFPAGHDQFLKSVFNCTDCATLLTEAFYVYDRLVTAHAGQLEIAAVDNPLDIARIHYIPIGPDGPR